MSSTIAFDADSFRTQCPAYSDPNLYPDAVLLAFWNRATCYISNPNSCLTDDCLRVALNDMTAHLVFLSNLITGNLAAGISPTIPGKITSSTVGGVSVTISEPPQSGSQFKYWLNQSPYGAAVLALLKVKGTGIHVFGSSFPRGAIRQPGGEFLSL